ncbi:IRK-interacting protein [Linum grandiflorum]
MPTHSLQFQSTKQKNRTPHRISETFLLHLALCSSPSLFLTKILIILYPIINNQITALHSTTSLIPFTCSNPIPLQFSSLCFFSPPMASAALASSTHHLFPDDGGELNRHELQSAIAKAVELRALHAALIQGTNCSPSSSSRPPLALPHFSAGDYPVFTPSYEDEPFQGTHYPIPARSRAASESWDECEVNYSSSCRKIAAEDQKSVTGSCTGGNNINNNNNNITVIRTSPELCKSGRSLTHLAADFKSSSSSCNRFRQTGGESTAAVNKKNRMMINSNIVVPLTDSHASVQSQPRSKGMMSWLFPRLRKNNKQQQQQKNEAFFSPNRATTESDNVSQTFGGESGFETLRRELRESNETRDAALVEVSETRSSLESLRQKLEHLEGYCEELKKSLKSAARSATRRGKSIDGNANPSNSIFPVSDEAMVEGFLQMASESRLSVKQFCKTLILQLDEYDTDLTIGNSNLDSNSTNSKSFLYQLESVINETMYLDFENCVFQRNGSQKHLDKLQDRQAKFQSFVSLRNLSWNEVLRKGTKYYSEEFSKFCDQKMSCIIAALNWTRPWPEQLLQAFFVAAKCIWLLHLLAFSFDPAIGVMRVEEGRVFDQGYMEDMERQRDAAGGGGGRRKVVKAMVMPGFYVHGGRVLRCKVLCRYYNSSHKGYASATS